MLSNESSYQHPALQLYLCEGPGTLPVLGVSCIAFSEAHHQVNVQTVQSHDQFLKCQ